jgi:hypothetical protein
MWDSIWINAHLATLRLGKYGGIRRAALAADHGRIACVGARAKRIAWTGTAIAAGVSLAIGLAAAALGAPLAAIFAVIAFAMLVYGLFTGLAVLRSKWPTER